MIKKILVYSLCLSSPVWAQVITFDEYDHGTIINNQYKNSHGLTISVDNPNRSADLGVIFDSNHPTPTGNDFDTDLIGPPTHNWAGGNIPTTPLGHLLIIAENNKDQNHDGKLDDPDDEGGRPAGSIYLTFDNPMTELGFDIVDVENAENGQYYTKYYKDGQFIGSVNFNDMLDSNSPYYDPSISFGDNTANTLPTVTASSLGVADFDKVKIHLGGSGGITNVRFDNRIPPPNTTVPEPNTILTFLFGLGMLRFFRKKVTKTSK